MKKETKFEILFADESQMINEVMQFAFEMDQFKVDIANSKGTIIQKCETKHYDLIIINQKFDILNTANEIKEIPINSDSIIFIISTNSDIEQKKQALENNISGWIVKPFVPEKLVKSIRYFLKTSI